MWDGRRAVGVSVWLSPPPGQPSRQPADLRWLGRPWMPHAEELGHLGSAVLDAVNERDQVGFVLPVELGLLAPQSTLGLGDLHALAGAQPDQVRLELRGSDLASRSSLVTARVSPARHAA